MSILLTQIIERFDPRSPMAILDLAAYGRSLGIDMRVGYAENMGDLSEFDAVWVSALIYDEKLVDFIRSIRERNAKRIVFGGKAASTLFDRDIELLEKMGVVIHEGHGELLLNGGTECDVAAYPPWSEDDFRALDLSNSMTDMMTSRGCPYHCHFCHNTEKRVTYFSHERSATHARFFLETLKRSTVFIIDDIFALKSSHMRGFLDMCDRMSFNVRGRTRFFVHASHLDDDRLDSIDVLQPSELQIGIESGDDNMLAAMGKTFTSEQAEAGLKRLHERGHRVACLFLMGFPGETRESLDKTVEFVRRNRKYMSGWWVSYFQPVPKTVGWTMASERVGHEVCGDRNTDINYLDPNLTVDDLQTARLAVMTP